MTRGRTLAEKVWERHVVARDEGRDLLYIDLHLVHEVTSPQAFDGLRAAGRRVRRPDLTLATADHNVPTAGDIADPVSRRQVDALTRNCAEHGIRLFPYGSAEQGIVHVIAPQMGLTQPGMTIVCGDSHTSTHGAFGAIAFGIGTSEVEHVLATQTLWQARPRTLAVDVEGTLPAEASAKDLALTIVRTLGPSGGSGHVLEYRGDAVRSLLMDERMTVCNMSIEAGARAGLIAPDDQTYRHLERLPHAPRGAAWQVALDAWRALPTDPGAVFDRTVRIDARRIRPTVTWGTNPAQSIPIDGRVPDPSAFPDAGERESAERALAYQGLKAGTAARDISVDVVFIGSCTNARLQDLRAAAGVLAGRRTHPRVRALVVPGSMAIRAAAEGEGLDRVFREAGFEWRTAGCSMCLGMNPDILRPGERCASTSNRNFEGRQGPGGRTHLVSPVVAAATAVLGHFATPSDLGAAALTWTAAAGPSLGLRSS